MKSNIIIIYDNGIFIYNDDDDSRRILDELEKLGIKGERKVVYCG